MSQLIQIQKNSAPIGFDCQTCGACCSFFARKEGIIDADTGVKDDIDLSYFVDEEIKFQWPDGDVETVHHEGFVMRTKALNGWPACVALTGEVGVRVSCSVYDKRPSPCRTFEAGSAACLHVRKWAGIDLEKIA